jgi:ABC-type bacteriocin/lantibiotic exporter with double-glycine peptidase domain
MWRGNQSNAYSEISNTQNTGYQFTKKTNIYPSGGNRAESNPENMAKKSVKYSGRVAEGIQGNSGERTSEEFIYSTDEVVPRQANDHSPLPSPSDKKSHPKDIRQTNIALQLLYKYFLEEKYTFIGIILLICIINILQTNIISTVTSSIIDYIEHNEYAVAYNQYYVFIGISLLYFILYTISELCQIKILTKLTPWLRIEFFKYIMRSNNAELSQQNVIKYNSPINRVSYSATSVVSSIFSNIISNGAFIFIISAYFLYKNVTLGLAFFTSNIILILYIAFNWNDMMYYKNIYETHSNTNEIAVIDLFNNFDKIIYRGQSEKEIDEYTQRSTRCMKASSAFYYRSTMHQLIMTIFIYVILFSALGYLIHLKFTSRITMQVFIAFFTILLLYRDKLTGILQMIPHFMEFHSRIDYVLEQFEDIKGEYSTNPLKTYRTISLPFNEIRFDNVSYKYATSEKYLFQNIHLRIPTTGGNVVGLTGVSGKGKSTIMKLLLKLHTYTEGKILIDDVDIREIDPEYIRKNITYVNQSGKLFNKSVIDNMLYGCSNEGVCKEYLDIIMKYPTIQRLYNNIEFHQHNAGMMGEQLSGGQRQVVNIISGLINPSSILILDEPTNALDLELKRELLDIIDAFRKYKKCIIIITHDRDVYPLFDREINV